MEGGNFTVMMIKVGSFYFQMLFAVLAYILESVLIRDGSTHRMVHETRFVELLLPFLRSPLTPTNAGDAEFLTLLGDEFMATTLGKKYQDSNFYHEAHTVKLSDFVITWFQLMDYQVECMSTEPPHIYKELFKIFMLFAKQKGLRL